MKRTALLLLVALVALPASAATTILSTDFESLAVGAATATSLDGVTTGGAWTLPTTPTDLNVNNYDTAVPGNRGLIVWEDAVTKRTTHELVSVTLTTAADFSAQEQTWSLDTLQQGAATTQIKNTIYEFRGNGGAVVAQFRWRSNSGLFQYGDGIGGWTDIGNVTTPAVASTTWDPTLLSTLSVTFSGTDVDVTFGTLTTPTTIAALNSTTNIESFHLTIQNTGTASKTNLGGHIDNLTASVVPEPATMSLLALGGMAMLRRKKK